MSYQQKLHYLARSVYLRVLALVEKSKKADIKGVDLKPVDTKVWDPKPVSAEVVGH